MSSREFMELVEGLPGDSWFKQALNADLKKDEARAHRQRIEKSSAEFYARLRGELRDPWDMTVELAEKRALD